MSGEKYISIGKLGKPHGISGAFRFLLERELKSKSKVPKHFMLEIKGSFLPWFIKNIEWVGFNDGFILFDEIINPENAKKYSGCALYLGEKDVNAFFKKDADSLHELIGYKVSDEVAGELGLIEDVFENPGQILLSINYNGKEIMIPFVDDFVLELNKRKHTILFSLPEGLLDL
ncbi:MAG: rimM [Bacteroidota bacterium]|nr:rimM [Bacteroidota bacterium]